MKQQTRKTASLLLALLLLLSFTGCSSVRQQSYDEGYDAGYGDGYDAADRETHQEAYDAGYRQGLQEGSSGDNSSNSSGTSGSSGSTGPYDPSGFVEVTDLIPNAILELRYYSTYNFIGDRIKGYEEPVILLSREAAEALKKVSDDLLQQGYRLKIFDGYRPQTAVNHFKTWSKDLSDIRMKPYFYPDLDKSVLFVRGFIASRSGHSRGSTVDLTLFDMNTGKEVDMGAPFDFFGEISHARRTEGLTEAQIENRRILREAMEKHGFEVLSTEWWHFTLKNEPYPSTYFDFPVRSLN
ncbi:MAG: peptidase M15 [Clostridiales bacterium]|nr:peptidase M15 [Clostridiales bacterium]